MSKRWVCIDCGARQAEQGSCAACRSETTLDSTLENTRELMYDVDLRLNQKRETRFRMIGVGVGMVCVIGLWLVPGFWAARSKNFALPFLLDQWLFMAVIGLGLSKGLEKLYNKKRFPYLDDQLKITD